MLNTKHDNKMKNQTPSTLFEYHLMNLQSVCLQAGEVFVCPLCFTVFSREEVSDPNKVNLGHIWPKFLRNMGEDDTPKHQHVLLCKSCNSEAGYRGDHEMQEVEIARQGDKSERPTRKRQIWIRPKTGEPDVRLRAYYRSVDEKSATIRFQDHPNAFKYNERYLRYNEYARSQIPCDVIVYPHDANWQLAQAGWLTSAYLFAFYTFGYRYIFHHSLDAVRDYILSSFDENVDRTLDYEADKPLSVRTCAVHYSSQPNIMYMIPVVGTKQIHFIGVDYLDYHVRLPGRDNHLVAQENSDEPDEEVQLSLAAKGHVSHAERCHWDDLFDPVDYCVIGTTLVARKSMET